MGIEENNLIKQIQIELSKAGYRLFRNQTGQAWQGLGPVRKITAKGAYILERGDVVLRGGRPIDYGLIKGSHDIIGWKQIKITAEMVGTVIAQFVSREVKTKNTRESPEQKIFRDNVNKDGGDARTVWSVEEAL